MKLVCDVHALADGEPVVTIDYPTGDVIIQLNGQRQPIDDEMVAEALSLYLENERMGKADAMRKALEAVMAKEHDGKMVVKWVTVTPPGVNYIAQPNNLINIQDARITNDVEAWVQVR
jgi:hypothetical protein